MLCPAELLAHILIQVSPIIQIIGGAVKCGLPLNPYVTGLGLRQGMRRRPPPVRSIGPPRPAIAIQVFFIISEFYMLFNQANSFP